MKTKPVVNHPLFNALSDKPPLWWKKLISDRELYVDVRKDNSINVYYNGASFMKLEYVSGAFRAKIHPKFIPLDTGDENIYFDFLDGNIFLQTLKSIEINNFEESAIKSIKERIKLINPTNKSEKGKKLCVIILCTARPGLVRSPRIFHLNKKIR